MTPQNLQPTLSRLGLSNAEAARLLGVHRSQVTRWLRGSSAVPGPVVRLLILLDHQHDRPVDEWLSNEALLLLAK